MNLVEQYGGSENLVPKYCPIDGSPLEVIDGVLICEKESHSWDIKLGPVPELEFFTLTLTEY